MMHLKTRNINSKISWTWFVQLRSLTYDQSLRMTSTCMSVTFIATWPGLKPYTSLQRWNPYITQPCTTATSFMVLDLHTPMEPRFTDNIYIPCKVRITTRGLVSSWSLLWVLLHQTLTSVKLGELELTFMRSSAREAKLHAILFDHGEVCKCVNELAKTYQAFLAEDVHGTCLAHMIDMSQLTQHPDLIFNEMCLRDTILPNAVILPFLWFLSQKHATTIHSTNKSPAFLILPRAKFLDKFSFRGVQYSTASSRTHNSHILFRPGRPDSSESLANPEPGQIIHTFLHTEVHTHCAQEDEGQVCNSSIYLCIRPYMPVQPELSDIDKSYQRFGFAGGFLSPRVGTLVSKQGVKAAFRLGMEGKCDVPDSYSRPLAQVE